MGDSITELSGYTTRLQTRLGTDYAVSNFGVAGTSLLKGGPVPYWTSRAFAPSHRGNPDIVVIMLGTNDSEAPIWGPHKNEFTSDYKALIDSYRTLPSHPRIILNLCLPAGTNPFGISGMVIETEINPQIRAIASEQGLTVVDLFATFGGHNFDPSLYGASDQVHPNAAGAQKIADAVYTAIVTGAPDGGTADSPPVDAAADRAGDRESAIDTTLDTTSDVAAEGPPSPVTPDAGDAPGVDAPSSDVARTSDAPGPVSSPNHPAEGCACSAAFQIQDQGGGAWLATLAALFLILRRRGSRHRPGPTASKEWRVANICAPAGSNRKSH